MKNEVVKESHFLPEDTDAMYAYIEAIKTLDLKPEVKLKLSQSHGHKYVFHVTALKPFLINGDYKLDVESYIEDDYTRGQETITIVNSNQPQYIDILFDKTFSGSPTIVAAPNTTVSKTNAACVSVSNTTSTGCRIWANRTSPGDVAINWIAYSRCARS